MKTIWTLILLTLLISCNSQKKALKKFSKIKVEIHTDLDEAIISNKANKTFLFIVFNDSDSIQYYAPITKTLKIDSTKDDISICKVLARDFSVVKLFRKQFDSIVVNAKYKFDENFKKSALEFNPTKSFLFISNNPNWSFYFARPLDSSKSEIHDIIWVKFGP